jgi:hypothetical protein
MDILGTILIAAGIPSAITSLGIGWLNRKLTRRQEEEERKEEARRKNEAIVIEGVMASITLGEATAKAVQRIPDAHCNGDMHAALEYATEVKNKHRDFIRKQGVDALY